MIHTRELNLLKESDNISTIEQLFNTMLSLVDAGIFTASEVAESVLQNNNAPRWIVLKIETLLYRGLIEEKAYDKVVKHKNFNPEGHLFYTFKSPELKAMVEQDVYEDIVFEVLTSDESYLNNFIMFILKKNFTTEVLEDIKDTYECGNINLKSLVKAAEHEEYPELPLELLAHLV